MPNAHFAGDLLRGVPLAARPVDRLRERFRPRLPVLLCLRARLRS